MVRSAQRLARYGHGLEPAVHTQLREDLVRVGSHGVCRNPELGGNVGRAAAPREAHQHVALPGSEHLQRPVTALRPPDVGPQLFEHTA